MKRVAILGFAPSVVDAPFLDATVDIWTMNYHHEEVPRTDRIFEMHDWHILEREDGGAHLKTLAAQTCPVYMLAHHAEIPTSRPYPIEAMKAQYTLPDADLPYFTNTASYMLAMAIEEGYESIELFGVDMANDTEYAWQRPSCEFFLGVAFGRGIKVHTHRLSDLLKTAYLYGYEQKEQQWMREKLNERLKYLQRLHGDHLRKMEEQKKAVYEVQGALQNQEHILKVWT